MLIDLLYDGLRRTKSKTEQSKIDGSKVAECQRNNPILDVLNNAPKENKKEEPKIKTIKSNK